MGELSTVHWPHSRACAYRQYHSAATPSSLRLSSVPLSSHSLEPALIVSTTQRPLPRAEGYGVPSEETSRVSEEGTPSLRRVMQYPQASYAVSAGELFSPRRRVTRTPAPRAGTERRWCGIVSRARGRRSCCRCRSSRRRCRGRYSRSPEARNCAFSCSAPPRCSEKR